MYKYLLAAICCINSVYACDFCGCSPSVLNADVLALQPQSSVGISVQYRNYKHLASDFNAKRTQIVTQNFYVSYAPAKWVDIRASLPVLWLINDYLKLDANTPKLQEKKVGIGDFIIFSNFRVWQKPPFSQKVGHIINLGYGMSFPTGTKKSSENMLLQDFNFGTQAIGFLFSGAYSISIGSWGLVNNVLIKVNLKNKQQVTYGNQYSYQVSANYSAYVKHFVLIPSVGFGVNVQDKNIRNNIIQKKSGAWNVALNYGLQFTAKGITFSASATHPLAQNTSNGDILQLSGFNCLLKYQLPQVHKKKVSETNLSITKN